MCVVLCVWWGEGKKDEEGGLANLDEIGVPGLEIVLRGFVFRIRSLDVLLAVLDHLC